MAPSRTSDHATASPALLRGLGWASIGLAGAAGLAPERTARLVGVRPSPTVRRALLGIGVQELLAGAGLLRRRRPRTWLWSRVAGDAVHLALLGRALADHDGDRQRMTRTMAALAGVAVMDLVAATRSHAEDPGEVRTLTTLTVNRRPEDVYRAWEQLETLPRFMTHLVSVERRDGQRSHWVARAPGGARVEWDAEVVDAQPGRRLAWRSLPGADVDNEGSVEFTPAPGEQGTEVTVDLRYRIPGGRAGRAVARMLGEHPDQQASDDLRRFKQVLETGEVSRSDGSPEGSRADRQWHQEPATPGW